MRLVAQLLAFLICPLACFAQSQVPRGHRPHSSGQFGYPRSVETGDEEQPPNRGFLQCVVNHLAPVSRQGSTADLFLRLGASTSGIDAVIVGHGAPGIICTGDGDHCSGEMDKMISSFNVPQWQKMADGLKSKFGTITLLGCDVGASPSGSSLMKDFANATGSTVIAADTIVFCGDGGITLADGGNWIRSDGQSSQNTTRPPSEAPSDQIFRFRSNSEFSTIALSSVRIVNFDHRDYSQREFRRLNLRDDHSLLSTIDLQNPLVIRAQPGAIVTGHLVLRWSVRDRPVVRKFILYNDELLEDAENLDVFYKTTVSFREQIAALTR